MRETLNFSMNSDISRRMRDSGELKRSSASRFTSSVLPTPEEPTPETPTPGTEIGKLILRFKYGWDWNNIRTEDTGEKGSSILLTIESGPAVPNKVILIAALTAAVLGTVSVILYRKKKKAADKA